LTRLTHLSQRVCDWPSTAQFWTALRVLLRRDCNRRPRLRRRPALSPMHALTLPVSAQELLQLAAAHATALNAQARGTGMTLPRVFPVTVPVLRVGFISADFRRHPVSILLAPALQLLRRHARRLQLALFALNQRDRSGWQEMLRSAAHQWHDLSGSSDALAAAEINAARVHVLIDLNGLYSRGSRPVLLAAQPSPLQAVHLGYGATTGADFIDFVIADRLVLPAAHGAVRYYTEKALLLPPSHLPSGHALLYPHMLQSAPEPCCGAASTVDGRSPEQAAARGAQCRSSGREEFGLSSRPPAAAWPPFVFAFFGQHLKIDSDVFASWMAVLLASPTSVLWLLKWPDSSERLEQAAAAHGVHHSRLVFSDRLPQGKHLCAVRLADLALDSPLYSSGATGIDALWSGVPLLAMAGALGSASCSIGASGTRRCYGTIFQRNALSLCTAAAQQYTGADSWPDYHQLAVAAARRTHTARALRGRAEAARTWAPLFDTRKWIAGFESGVRTAWELVATGSGVMHVHVAAV